jgi:heme exporter protein A
LYNTSFNAEKLGASRGGFALFDNVSFSLSPGDALRVTGPNGTGKTTLLRCLAGFLQPDSGSMSKTGDQNIHYLGHLNAMKLQLTVAENLTFWANANIDSHYEAAIKTMNLTGLVDLPFGVLSSGQKRRAAIARLLLSPRHVWLLDEPTVGLDINAIALFESVLEHHLGQGGIIIAATHTPLGKANWQKLELQPPEPSGKGRVENEMVPAP